MLTDITHNTGIQADRQTDMCFCWACDLVDTRGQTICLGSIKNGRMKVLFYHITFH